MNKSQAAKCTFNHYGGCPLGVKCPDLTPNQPQAASMGNPTFDELVELVQPKHSPLLDYQKDRLRAAHNAAIAEAVERALNHLKERRHYITDNERPINMDTEIVFVRDIDDMLAQLAPEPKEGE